MNGTNLLLHNPHALFWLQKMGAPLLSFEDIQATQNENAAHFNQSCSGLQVNEIVFLILKILPVEK